MASTQFPWTCEHCKTGDQIRIMDFLRGHHSFYCMACGYSERIEYKMAGPRKFLRIDETKDWEYDNLQIKYHKTTIPYCSYTIEFINRSITTHTVKTKEQFDKFSNNILELPYNFSRVKRITMSRFIDEGKFETVVSYESDIDFLSEEEIELELKDLIVPLTNDLPW
jgi:hypothetical protein